MQANEGLITVEVSYALPERQRIVKLTVAPGTSAFDAVLQSGIVATLTEVIIQCPLTAGEVTFRRNALLRLEYVLRKKGVIL